MTGAERSAADGATPVTGAGDRDGFAALFDRHRRELQVYCYRMLGSFHEAEDLVQETFERAWLYRIATNACLDALRQRRRRRVLPFEVMDLDRPLPAATGELWLEPFPDRLLGDPVAVVRADTVAYMRALAGRDDDVVLDLISGQATALIPIRRARVAF